MVFECNHLGSLGSFLLLRRSTMFIARLRLHDGALRRSAMYRAIKHLAPNGANVVKSLPAYKHFAPPEQSKLGQVCH